MSSLSPMQRELLRDQLLASMRDSADIGLPLDMLQACARAAAFKLTAEELEQHLHYLVSGGLAAVRQSAVSAALRRWTITASGMNHLEVAGL